MRSQPFTKIFLFTILVCGFHFAPLSFAKEGEQIRGENPLGIGLGIMEPFPCLLGAHIGFNFWDIFRATAGYGTAGSPEASLTTYGGGVKLFFPKWKVAPFVSLNMVSVTHKGSKSLHGINSDLQHLYSSLGVDVQLESGFNMGLAYQISWTGGISGLPALYFAWYFNPVKWFK